MKKLWMTTLGILLIGGVAWAGSYTITVDDMQSSDSDKLVVDESGNVGIGTASPRAKLEVVGNPTFVGGATGTRAYFRFGSNRTISGMTELGNIILGGTTPENVAGYDWYSDNQAAASANSKLYFYVRDGGLQRALILDGSTSTAQMTWPGNVGIGTAAPGNPLAVNRSGDGVIVDFESADTVEGNVSISGNTTSYNAFVGSHYTQLKDGQAEFPVGAVVVSTGEIIPCSVSKQKYTKVNPLTAVNIIDKADAVEIVDVEVEDKDNIISQESTYSFDPETGEEKETITYTYGTKTVQKKKLVDGAHFHRNTRQFYTIKPGYVSKKEDGKLTFYLEETVSKLKPNKEYFVYVDTTTTAADKRAYGVMLGKMSDDAKGMSFGKDIDPVYLIAQVGLFKIRVTDTNGNIENGDYLETSTRAMEAQKQASGSRLNSTIAKSMIDVDWATEAVDVVLGYKWKLIPCTF